MLAFVQYLALVVFHILLCTLKLHLSNPFNLRMLICIYEMTKSQRVKVLSLDLSLMTTQTYFVSPISSLHREEFAT